MDANRFTETALQLLGSAREIARTRRNPAVTPLHLARALVSDAQQPPARVLERAGGSLPAAQAALDAALGREPTVAGAATDPAYTGLAAPLEEAERQARRRRR